MYLHDVGIITKLFAQHVVLLLCISIAHFYDIWWIVYILHFVELNVIRILHIATVRVDVVWHLGYVPRLNLRTGRYYVKYIWTKRDTNVESVAQLKLIILDHVNMTCAIYTLTCKHCMICQFDNYLYLCTYIAQSMHKCKHSWNILLVWTL